MTHFSHSLFLQVLISQVEGERERRLKAEMAAERLVEHVRSLQSQVAEGQRRHELAVVRVAEVENQLKGEREDRKAQQTQAQQLEVGDICRIR